MHKSDKFSVRARIRSFVFAARGLRTMLESQHNAWLHALATMGAVGLGFVAKLGPLEWASLVFAVLAVWTAEALNTALEFLCDVASPEFHPLVEKAKDVAAGAVLISALGALAIASLVLVPALSRL